MKKICIILVLICTLVIISNLACAYSASPGMSLEDIVAATWQFERGDGSIICRSIKLLPDGKIEGYYDENESRWAYENGVIVFYHTSGRPSCIFSSLAWKDGKAIVFGQFEFTNNNITHILRQTR